MAAYAPVTADTLITVKVAIQGSSREFKLPLGDLNSQTLPARLRALLNIPDEQEVVFERYSDSAGAYITLDPANLHVYKSLYRAAKAKLKLRLKASLPSGSSVTLPPDISKIPSVNDRGPSRPNGFGVFSLPMVHPTLPVIQPLALSSETTLQSNNGVTCVNTITSEHILPAASNKPVQSPVREEADALVPQSSSARDNFYAELANLSRARELALRMKESPVSFPASSWSVYCNNCDKPMSNEHYHCSICDEGDYDLCSNCVEDGVHCPGEEHWLVKRFVQNGKMINSTTERVEPKPKEVEVEMPGAFTEEKKAEIEEPEIPTRTCNSCVKVLPDSEFVTCTTCEDYDLCICCHVDAKHGHHPGHAFKAATSETQLGSVANLLCAPGRNVRHSAICDGCDSFIEGVRYKCLNCPDWDFCSDCHPNAKNSHPKHRFVPIYEPLTDQYQFRVRHYGIYCDGPLCQSKNNQTYIAGVRYKCAICHDTDFCANCEAHPSNKHNRTHPLIKFKTPVRNVSVTTLGEDRFGSNLTTMGDQRVASRCPAFASPSANAATEVQTIVDVKPTEAAPPKPAKEKIEIKDLLAEPIQEKIRVQDLLATPIHEAIEEPKVEIYEAPKPVSPKENPAVELNAHFLRDTISDGTMVACSKRFTQIWTLRNPGPKAWPAGCSVRYVGGDNMLDLDHAHPSSAADLADATESNIIHRTVAVGEEIAFRVQMRAPKREGTSISYWRLKTPENVPFGHRLWCHINVTSTMTLASQPSSPQTFPRSSPHAEDPLPQATECTSMQAEFLKRQAEINKMVAKIKKRVKEEQDAIEAKLKAQNALDASLKKALEKVVEAKEQPATEEVKPEASQMIFPTLEKESPVSSTHDIVAPSSSGTQTVQTAPSAPASHNEEELFEDAETVELLDSESSDDEAFLTDEEYDILDASDEDLA